MVISAFDETNRRVQPAKIREAIKPGDKALIAFAGVQSNQFPRAVDVAPPVSRAGHPCLHGGISCLGLACRCFPTHPLISRPRRNSASACSRAKPRTANSTSFSKTHSKGPLKPLYNFMSRFAGHRPDQPMPILPLKAVNRERFGITTSVDTRPRVPLPMLVLHHHQRPGAQEAGFRSADDLEAVIRENYAKESSDFFFTDDNFARNRQLGDRFSTG